jgi:hypothetical protein
MSPVAVPLSKGRVALIDADDAKVVLAHRWYAASSSATHCYAARCARDADGKWRRVYLHRLLMADQLLPGLVVDHINRDTLDNRRQNLRAVTQGRNIANGRRRREQIAPGVYKSGHGWIAKIHHGGQAIYLGTYQTYAEAVAAHAGAHIAIFGMPKARNAA